MATQMSDAAKRLGRRNALIALAVIFIVPLGTFCLLKFAFGLAWSVALLFASALLTACCLVIGVGSLRAWAAAGPVLFDCRTTPRKGKTSTRLVFAALFGALAVSSGAFAVAAWLHGEADDAIMAALSCFVWSIFAVVDLWPPGLQLRENGIWSTGSLLRWDRIKSYHWEGEDGLTLMIEYASWLPLLRQRAIIVPAEHKQKFDEALRRRPGAEQTSG